MIFGNSEKCYSSINAKEGQNLLQSAETHTSFPLLFRTSHSQRLEFRSTLSSLFPMKLVFERLKIESYHDVSVTRIGESVSSPCSGLPYKLPGRSLNTEVLPISPFRLSLPARILAKW